MIFHRAYVCTKIAPTGVGHDILFLFLAELDLLVCLGKVKLFKCLAICQFRKQVMDFGNKVPIQPGCLVDCQLKITANSDRFLVTLKHWHNWCCPSEKAIGSMVLSFSRQSSSSSTRPFIEYKTECALKYFGSIRVHLQLCLEPFTVPTFFKHSFVFL